MLAINPRWLTANVCDLATTISDARDVSRLPILADALMDAGCNDEELLVYLRSRSDEWTECLDWFKGYCWIRYDREAEADDLLNWMARWSRDGIQQAIATVNDFAARVGGREYYDEGPVSPAMTFAEFMNAAAQYLAHHDYVHMGTNEAYKDVFWPVENERQFWSAYEILTGETVAESGSFFRCSC